MVALAGGVPDFSEFFTSIMGLVRDLGVTKGLFVAFFSVAHAAVWMLYRGRLNDRQREIDRLAAENKEYRERFTAMLDKNFGIKKGQLLPPKEASPAQIKGDKK